MIIPIRCFTCGQSIAQHWEKYKARVKKGEKSGKVLDSLEVSRPCCRSVFLTHVDLTEKVGKFKK